MAGGQGIRQPEARQKAEDGQEGRRAEAEGQGEVLQSRRVTTPLQQQKGAFGLLAMKPISEFTEKELNDELGRRIAAKEKERNDKKLARAKEITAFLTREVVDYLQPNHDKGTCSDANICNGIKISYISPRCRRCTMLDALEEGWPTRLNLHVRIDTYDD